MPTCARFTFDNWLVGRATRENKIALHFLEPSSQERTSPLGERDFASGCLCLSEWVEEKALVDINVLPANAADFFGRMPVSSIIVATSRSGCEAASRYSFFSRRMCQSGAIARGPRRSSRRQNRALGQRGASSAQGTRQNSEGNRQLIRDANEGGPELRPMVLRKRSGTNNWQKMRRRKKQMVRCNRRHCFLKMMSRSMTAKQIFISSSVRLECADSCCVLQLGWCSHNANEWAVTLDRQVGSGFHQGPIAFFPAQL